MAEDEITFLATQPAQDEVNKMVKSIVIAAVIVLLGILVLTILAITNFVPFIIWVAVTAPLIVGLVGFLLAFVAAVTGLISEENVKKYISFGSGAASGITAVRISDWWNKMNQFLQNPKPDIGVFVVGSSLVFGLAGISAGLSVGRQRKPALQQLATQTGKALTAVGSAAIARTLLMR